MQHIDSNTEFLQKFTNTLHYILQFTIQNCVLKELLVDTDRFSKK